MYLRISTYEVIASCSEDSVPKCMPLLIWDTILASQLPHLTSVLAYLTLGIRIGQVQHHPWLGMFQTVYFKAVYCLHTVYTVYRIYIVGVCVYKVTKLPKRCPRVMLTQDICQQASRVPKSCMVTYTSHNAKPQVPNTWQYIPQK
jgi:hypothetical protein